jgi:peroxiredoxin
LNVGHELVYRGTFTEESLGKGVQFSRSYRLDGRVFVLEATRSNRDVAFYTVLKLRNPQTERSFDPEPSSIRLELGRIDAQGRVSTDSGASLAVVLDGPSTVECGAFVELPRGQVVLNQFWEVAEANRPNAKWKAVGTEIINGATCVKLEGIQQSDDWDQPRGDRTAWRRVDHVWISNRLGVAYKVDRQIERRDPAHRDATQRLTTQYEMQGAPIQYPGQLLEDRRREIGQARKLYESVAPYLPNPTKADPRIFDMALEKIKHHLDSQPPTPYRDAVFQVKRRVEAAKRGESPPMLAEETAAGNAVAAIGQMAPDFVTTNLLTRESAKLRQWHGRPILMVFYSPTSLTAEQLLRFAQKTQDTHGKEMVVLGLAIAEDADRLRRQHDELNLSIAILSGKGLRQTYGVDATPKLIVIDSEGVVRGSYVGWGPETAPNVSADLKSCFSRTTKTKAAESKAVLTGNAKKP